jgi:hypothetical protein
MIRIAPHFGGNTVLHGYQQRAGIGTVMRAGGADNGSRHDAFNGNRFERRTLNHPAE